MPVSGEPAVFALEGTEHLAAQVASHVGVSLSEHEERTFPDGEHKARPLASVRGRHAYVIHSLHGHGQDSVDDKLVRVLFFCGALREAGARTVTAVLPYLCYGRADRQTQPQDPVSTRYVAVLIEAMGVDRVIALDVHDLAAFQNAFRCQSENLTAAPLLVQHVAADLRGQAVCVVAPDAGGAKRARVFRELLSAAIGAPVASAYAEKVRTDGQITGELLAGEVGGRVAVVFDDMIASGATMLRAARRCREEGAEAVFAVATHGVFTPGAGDVLAHPHIDRVVTTDSIPPTGLVSEAARVKLEVVPAARLLAEAIVGSEPGESASAGKAPDSARP